VKPIFLSYGRRSAEEARRMIAAGFCFIKNHVLQASAYRPRPLVVYAGWQRLENNPFILHGKQHPQPVW
jgi:hypothetical protein